MASKGQLLMAQAIQKDNKKRKDQTRESEEQMGKRSGWGGWGRSLLGLAGGLAGATVGMPWLGAGIGSMAGSKIGQTLAGGVDKIDDTDFGVTATEDINREIGNYGRKENEMVVGRGIRDAFSAYVAPQMFEKGAEKLASWGADKPQFLGDWGSKQFGIGSDKFGKRITEETLANPKMSWLKAQQGLTEEQINDQLWSQNGASTPSVNQSSIVKQHINNPVNLTPSGAGNTVHHNSNQPFTPTANGQLPVNFRNIIDNHIGNNNALSQAVNNNASKASPYIQNTGKYISPEAKRQMMLRGLLSKSQSGGQYGS